MTAESHQAAACWVCGAARSTPWKARSIERPLWPEDLQITDASYGTTLALRRCDACGFLFAEGDDIAELTALYEQLADAEYEATQDSRRLQMEKLLDRLHRARPGARTLLDIGAGAGLLVEAARRRGLEAEGVEPSRSLVEAAGRLHDVDLHQGVFPHPGLAERRFEMITLVDVIEHVGDPVGLLRALGEALEPGGALLLVTPDARSLAARLLGRRWWHFRLAHVGYFDRRNLTLAVQRAGLEVERVWRAGWYFRVGYLADRVGEYLPGVGGLNRLLRKIPPVDWLYRRVMPLNLLDSWAMILRPADRRSMETGP